MLASACDYLLAKGGMRWRHLPFGWWGVVLFLAAFLLARSLLERRRKTGLLWKVPGCDVNYLFLFLAIARAIVLNNTIKTNILSFQVLCGTTVLFRKEQMWRMWIGLKPVVVFFKPQSVEAILSSNTVLKKTFMYNFLNYWFKEGLITSSGNKWRARRKLLTPAFHFRILGDFQPVIDEQSKVLCQVLEENEGQVFDVVQPVTFCTLDILCETAMGIKIQAQRKHSDYIEALKVASEQFSDRVMKPWVWSDLFYYRTRDGQNYKESIEVMQNFTGTNLREQDVVLGFCSSIRQQRRASRGLDGSKITRHVIRERKASLLERKGKEEQKDKEEEETGVKIRKAFLDLLLELHLMEGEEEILSEEDIREEVDTFMFAGHDTTAMGISWALYNIGLLPDVQQGIHDELDRIFGDDTERPITAEDVREMKYLECVLKESQRLYPSLPVIGRELEEDTLVAGYTLPSGTTCMLATFMLHRDSDTFPDPERFDPDRFLPDNCVGRHPFAYVPFSAGPRNCIGQRFAMLEEKTVVANVLRRFRVETLDGRDKLRLTAEMVLRNDGPLRMRVRRRQPSGAL